MGLADKIIEKIKSLPEEKQAEVLDFVDFLQRKLEEEEKRECSKFSLELAMRGMEEEKSSLFLKGSKGNIFMIAEGQIVLFRFPQTNLKEGKLCPALVIRKVPGDYDDWLICMISSRLHQKQSELDEIIKPEDDDFIESGLKTISVIRVSRIAVVEKEILLGKTGNISPERLQRIKKK
jgi:mRNA interferase MazF